ncbi:MAG: protoheme IX farnesyltransferase [Candidatus Pelagibacter sp. TMED128]|nr:MAG: protoheme IX farnesyltransferase [Candidatus Pelagibacter sp. TMED128]
MAKNKTSPVELSLYLKSFLLLMKPRVMSLVLFTAMVGLLVAPISVSFTTASLSLLAVAIGSGAAGALNMWYESDVDALMSRTCLRPIPTGKIKRKQALLFGVVLSFISIIMLYISSNLISALLLAATISFYFFIYTIWLKRKTAQNIVIGGAAGALPPVIGWAVAMNNISIEPVIMFLIIFIWTPSHFWALSLYKFKDYERAKIPMLPVTAGIEKTKLNILLYAILMFPIVLAPFYAGFGSIIYLVLSMSMTIYYIRICYLLFKTKAVSKSNLIARKVFVYSIFYLFFLFLLILFDNLFKLNQIISFF